MNTCVFAEQLLRKLCSFSWTGFRAITTTNKGMPSANIAEWMILFACPPGKPSEPAGILLLDKSSDQLFLRLKERLSTSDNEINEVWKEIASDVKSWIGQSGGAKTMNWLELTASHILRVSDRRLILVEDLLATVDQLYDSNIAS